MEMVTGAFDPVTRFPSASSSSTCTAGEIAAPAVVFDGWVTNSSRLTEPAVTLNGALVTLSPPPPARMVYPLPGRLSEMLSKVARPSTAVRVSVPLSVAPPGLLTRVSVMLEPKLVLMDEPSAGLSPKMVNVIFDQIRKINETGPAILIVEQNAKLSLEMSHRGYVLASGENRFEGTGQELLNDPEVGRLYLGG